MQMASYRRYPVGGAPNRWCPGIRAVSRHRKEGSTNQRVCLWVSLVMACVIYGLVPAQGVSGVDPSGRPRVVPPPLLPDEPLREEPQLGPLQSPTLPPLPPLPAEPPEPLSLDRIFVSEIRIVGGAVFPPAELAEVTAPYVNRFLTAEDLEELRLALTRHYVARGYVNSGAIIPDQTVTEGVLTLQVIEGELSRIEVEGNRWFRASYFQNRLALGAGPPLNINALQERLQLLLQDPRIQRLNAELRPGVRLGESVLDVRVEERNPYRVWLAFNNYQSPTVGAERGLVTVAHENVTGYGDILSVQYGRSSGVDLQLDAGYTLPLTARDTTVAVRYRRNTFLVVEAPFEPLDVNSRSEIFGVALRQPLYRSLSQEFALELIGERLSNQTFLLDQPFSFAPGAHRGLSTDTAVRVAPQWVYRTPTQVLAARSQFSVGIDALGATINPSSLPDGRFFAWLGQLQWARRLGLWDAELLWRTDLQLANNPLLPLEQIAVGGRYSVRGYRENQLVRDNGLLVSLEARLTVVREHRWAEYLQVAPFIDFGRAWNTRLPTPDPETLASVGLGLRWAATVPAPFSVRPQFEVYWGVPLNQVDTPGGNLQDWGLHLQLIVALF
jgi:hemolysin activation/secretion protein